MEKNSNLQAAHFVVARNTAGRLKFLAGYDDPGDASAAASEFAGEVMAPADFFAERPEMTPEAERDDAFFAKYPQLKKDA